MDQFILSNILDRVDDFETVKNDEIETMRDTLEFVLLQEQSVYSGKVAL